MNQVEQSMVTCDKHSSNKTKHIPHARMRELKRDSTRSFNPVQVWTNKNSSTYQYQNAADS